MNNLNQTSSCGGKTVKASVSSNEIELVELWSTIWRGKLIVLATVFLFSIASVFYALSLPNIYKSSVVLAPAQGGKNGGIGALAGQFGGLASLAGINLASGTVNKASEALEIIKSWAFIEEFVLQYELARDVFAARGWNQETDELIYDPNLYDKDSNKWIRIPLEGRKSEPSSWELYLQFSSYMSISEDQKTGFVTLSIEFYSPKIAKKWVDSLVEKINFKLKTRDAEEAKRNIAFLEKQIKETSLTSMQTVFYQLIEEQTKTLMLTEGAQEYVFKTVSEARISEERSRPKRALICVVGAFLGGAVGILIVLVRILIRKNINA
ncbi:MAG: LPS O-antigen length regulator [Hahellaceae bacterium]|nr:LPS O-antigen length regulator [Hahellaceae bacterium]